MTTFRESLLFRICLFFCASYMDSGLRRLLIRAGAWCNAQIDGSRLLRPLCREGALARAWPESLLCRLLSALADLPAALLRWLYRAFQPTWDTSVTARLVFAAGDETPSAQFWLTALLWIIPYDYWNNAYTMTAFAFLLLLFHASAMHRAGCRLDVRSIGFYPLVFFGSIFLAALYSSSRSLSMRFLVYHISAALCVLVTVSAIRRTADLLRIAAGGGMCVLVSSLYAFVQRIQGVEVNKSYVDMELNAGMPGRVDSFFNNPNAFAEVLVLLLPVVLALALAVRPAWGKALFGAAFLAGCGAILMTYSRASWVGLACAMVVMVFLWKPKLLPGFIALCCLGIPLLPDTVWNRILTIGNLSDSSTASRFPLYQAALKVIQVSPVAGAGLGTAAVQRFIRLRYLYRGSAPFVHAHNFYLQIWLEAGLLGIASFLGAMLWNIKRAAHAARHCKDSAARTVTCGAAAALCGAMVNGLADYLWNYPRVMCIFWFVFALALAGVKLCRE